MNFEDFYNHLQSKDKESKDNVSKGKAFEYYTKSFIKKCISLEKSIAEDKIYLWKDFPYKSTIDLGIDIVYEEERDGVSDFVGVQCKFKEKNTTLYADDLKTFLGLLNSNFDVAGKKRRYSRGEIYTTSSNVSKNLTAMLKDFNPTTKLITYSDFCKYPFDFTSDVENIKVVKKELRAYQKKAIEKITEGFLDTDRGKLIMACGTGKTLVAVKVVKNFSEKSILYLLPSLSLVQQTLNVFSSDSDFKLEVGIVCSAKDIKTPSNDDEHLITKEDLICVTGLKPTTDVKEISRFIDKESKKRTKILFCTYQSLDKIYEAYKTNQDLRKLDLVICDEAHKTAGVKEKEKISNFRLIQDKSKILYDKILFMTATPKIYGGKAKKQAENASSIETLFSMDNESVYGKVFFEYNFDKAIKDGFLTDYKVVILKIKRSGLDKSKNGNVYFTKEFPFEFDKERNILDTENEQRSREGYHKVIFDFLEDKGIKRALNFTGKVSESKDIKDTINQTEANKANKGNFEAYHLDGDNSIFQRKSGLDWLEKEEEDIKKIKIMSNAKLLTEGIDVPNIDCIIFSRPKSSTVDIVQAVGRAIRKSKNKQFGYIILPIIVPSDIDDKQALNSSQYKEIWKVLSALRSHDEALSLEIDKINFNTKPEKIDVVEYEVDKHGNVTKIEEDVETQTRFSGLDKDASFDTSLIYTKILDEVGDTDYWDAWTNLIVDLFKKLKDKIHTELTKDEIFEKEFLEFIDFLKKTVKEDIDKETVEIMLCQHLISEPIFHSLFNDKDILSNIPIYKALEDVLSKLQTTKDELRSELKEFYETVEKRAKNITNFKGRQDFLNKVYDDFFRKIDKEVSKSDGVFYTRQDVVQFMIRISNDIFKKEFNKDIDSKEVLIIDPFVGTGNFIVNILDYFRNTLNTSKDDMAFKYTNDIFCNEINLLAYYIASVNIEYTYQELTQETNPFKNISFVDTFKTLEDTLQEQTPEFTGDLFSTLNDTNTKRIETQKKVQFNFLITNPPYFRDKKGSYEKIDDKIESWYQKNNDKSKNFMSLYDHYVRTFVCIQERLDNDGVACVITNNSFIDNNTFYLFREHLQRNFYKVYHFDLKGAGRHLSKEEIKKQGGNVFGIMTRVGITILVKKKEYQDSVGKVFLYSIKDYTKQEEKLKILENIRTLDDLKDTLKEFSPVEQEEPYKNIWINQGNKEYHNSFVNLCSKDNTLSIFTRNSKGLKSNRETWVIDFSREQLETKAKKLIEENNKIIKDSLEKHNSKDFVMNFENVPAKEKLYFKEDKVIEIFTKPFVKKWCYLEKKLFHSTYQTLNIFRKEHQNIGICLTDKGHGDFSSVMSDINFNLALIKNTNVYPLYFFTDDILDSNINKGSLEYLKKIYNKEITDKELFYYVYGITNSLEYKEVYENDLFRNDPKIPILKKVDDFLETSKIGQELSKLHLGYETLDPYQKIDTSLNEYDIVNREGFTKLKYNDIEKTSLKYNEHINIDNIPVDLFNKYLISGKNIVDHLIGYYKIQNKTDIPYLDNNKMFSNPNNFDTELKGKYIYDLIQKGITLGIKTQKLLESIPKIDNNFIEKIKN